MTDSDNSPFIYNVFFIGAEGFREHFKIAADTADDLAARRKAILGLLKEWGAFSDTRKVYDDTSKAAGPSKLDKFRLDETRQPHPSPDEVPQEVKDAVEETVKENVAFDAANKKPTDALKPSKLSKYARPEKE